MVFKEYVGYINYRKTQYISKQLEKIYGMIFEPF